MLKCFDCENVLKVDVEADIGHIVLCQRCGAEYEIVKTNPIKLKLIEEEK